jgi:hypothetical protein
MAEVASQPPGTPNGGAAMAGAAAAQLATPPSALQGPGDALDSPDFDAVKFLNEMFPTGTLSLNIILLPHCNAALGTFSPAVQHAGMLHGNC